MNVSSAKTSGYHDALPFFILDSSSTFQACPRALSEMTGSLIHRVLFENGEKVAAMMAIQEQENSLLTSRAEDRLAPLQACIKQAGHSLREKASHECGSLPPPPPTHQQNLIQLLSLECIGLLCDDILKGFWTGNL